MAKPILRHKINFRRNAGVGKSVVRIEHSAGGVVFRRVERRILVGFIKDSYHKWTFPKGHVEKGETVGEAALRETREEMGFKKLRLVARLGGISIRFKDRYQHVGAMIHKDIDFFLMEAPGSQSRGVPQREERIYEIRWVPYRAAGRLASYKNIQPIIKNAVAYLDNLAAASYPHFRPSSGKSKIMA